jgi:hypothetical protein
MRRKLEMEDSEITIHPLDSEHSVDVGENDGRQEIV